MLDTARNLDDLRAEVRAWVQENYPPALRSQEKQEQYFQSQPVYPDNDPDFALWKKRVVEKGWSAPSWPKEYGGGGYDTVQGHAIMTEIVRAGAFNPCMAMGMSMFGPTLLEYGSDEQKARHIPSIVRGEIRWCQGYSEPGAGSDLAGLKTKAEDKGDHYLVNGQKIWTSGSYHAHWCFCLVRTDPNSKHDGISFILIDMKTPGVEVRPIKIISGQSPFSEVFFTDVKVPKENLVGKLNKGWTIAKRLLQHERNGVSNGRRAVAGDTRPLEQIAKDYLGVDGEGRIANSELRTRITKHLMRFKALTLLQARMVEESKVRKGPSEATSVLKNTRARTQQEREELLVEIFGFRGIGWGGEGFTDQERDTTRAFLSNKAMTIFSGTSEIQNNIIAKRMLGLLDHQ